MNKDYDEALELFSKAIEIDNKDPIYYTNSKFWRVEHQLF